MADQFRAWKAWPEIQSFSRRQQPSPARRRRAGDPHGRPGLTSKNCDRSHTHTYTSKRVSHSHLTPWSPPSPLPDGPFKLPALGPAPPSPNMPKRKAEFTHGHPHWHCLGRIYTCEDGRAPGPRAVTNDTSWRRQRLPTPVNGVGQPSFAQNLRTASYCLRVSLS